MEWMYLWLTCALDEGLSRMSVEQSAIDTGLVTPMFRWGAMAVPGNGNVAYLARRPGGHAPDRGELTEVGVVGHGHSGREFAHRVADEIRTWDAQYRQCDVRFEILDGPGTSDPTIGRFVLDRPHRPVTATWCSA